jgi:hypothetical protein
MFTASAVGVYPSRIRAEGYFQNKDKFTREKTLTAATYRGNYDTTPRGDDTLCGLLHCLTSGKVITKQAMEKLRTLGIDWEQFQKCIDKVCPEVPDHLPAVEFWHVPDLDEMESPQALALIDQNVRSLIDQFLTTPARP